MTIRKHQWDAWLKVTAGRLWIIYGVESQTEAPSACPSCQNLACRTRSAGDTGRRWRGTDSWLSPWRRRRPSGGRSRCTGIFHHHLWRHGRCDLRAVVTEYTACSMSQMMRWLGAAVHSAINESALATSVRTDQGCGQRTALKGAARCAGSSSNQSHRRSSGRAGRSPPTVRRPRWKHKSQAARRCVLGQKSDTSRLNIVLTTTSSTPTLELHSPQSSSSDPSAQSALLSHTRWDSTHWPLWQIKSVSAGQLPGSVRSGRNIQSHLMATITSPHQWRKTRLILPIFSIWEWELLSFETVCCRYYGLPQQGHHFYERKCFYLNLVAHCAQTCPKFCSIGNMCLALKLKEGRHQL